MKAKQQQTEAEQLFEHISKLLTSGSGVTRMRMFGAPGLRINGKVFATHYKGNLVLKLSRQRVDALVATGDGEHWEPGHGRDGSV